MAEEGQSSGAQDSLGTSRMEAFSDGVIAIAITLLVLEVAVRPPGSPLEQFLRGWPSYLAYVVSFVTIGAAWIGHHALTERLERADPVLLRLNLLFLLLIGFLPFPTRMVADSLSEGTGAERVAVTVYGLTLLAIRLAFFAMDAYTATRAPGGSGAGRRGHAGGAAEVPRGGHRLRARHRGRVARSRRRDRLLLRHRPLPRTPVPRHRPRDPRKRPRPQRLLTEDSGNRFGHRPLLQVLLEAGHTHLAADPGLLEATEGHVGAVPEATVDRHGARPDAAGHPQHALAVSS